jgi:hypothetical protein
VFDAVDVQDVLFDVEGEQHPIVTAACGAQAEEFVRQRFTQSVRAIGQDASDEFDDR